MLDLINPDAMARDILDASGFPAKNINDPETVQGIRKQKQEAAQQQQEFDQTIETAKAMPAVGKAIDPTSAAGRLIEASEEGET